MIKNDKESIDVSFIITISEDVCEMEDLYTRFNEQMKALNKTAEFIFVQNRQYQKAWQMLGNMVEKYQNCMAIRVREVFNEADCLNIGFQHAQGKYLVTIPIYYQIDPRQIGGLLQPLIDEKVHLTMAARIQRKDAWLNRIESIIYNTIIRKMTGIPTHDLGSGVVAMKTEVAKSIELYGELFRFIPILVDRKGYNIKEVSMRHFLRRNKTGIYSFGSYLRRFLDIVTIFFLLKFTKKPLRFFGFIGGVCCLVSIITGSWLLIAKMGGQAIGSRPLLALCSLIGVLGVQLFSMGLIGEIIIFTHAKEMKEYFIEEIIE